MVCRRLLLSSLFSGLVALPALSQAALTTDDDLSGHPAQSPEEAIRAGDLGLDLRLRVEHIDRDTVRNGHANTFKTALRYGTASYWDVAAFMEFVNVTAHGNNEFNPGNNIAPSKSGRPVIADPKGTAMTKAYLQYDGLPDTRFRLGRQALDFDDERHVGSERFRQTPQSVDGFLVQNQSLGGVELLYAFVNNFNTVYQGTSIANADRHHQTHLLNASWDGLPYGQLTAYGYFINDRHTSSNSNHTYGMRFVGDSMMTALNIQYMIEAARQHEGHNNQTQYHGNFFAASFGVQLDHNLFARLGHESVEGNRTAGKMFRFPMGSAHPFLGLADMFSPIPNSGVDASMMGLTTEFYGIDMDFAYHRFKPETGDGRLGSEWDAQFSKTFLDMYEVKLDFAQFSASSNSGLNDTTKIWFSAAVHL